ncbi:MAG TPA: CPBP family intramembrane glutamic endopeptidase [Anaerolineales bacterium]|nr:CPBP family intramembrane glutamic endopeptidase [Anaerolineales bacterium]
MFKQLSSLSKATLFYGIALGLILLLALLGQGLGESILAIAMFTPLLAVLLMQFVLTRDGTTRAGWRILGLQRSGLRLWGFAILTPFLVLLCTYGIIWAAGLGHLDLTALAGSGSILGTVFNLLISLIISMILVFGEEIGWRGYLLPHLLPLGRTRALLLSGLLHGIWHLPIMLLTPFYHASGDRLTVAALFLLSTTFGGVFFGYLRLTSQSVWPAVLAHGALNMFWTMFMSITVAVTSAEVLEYWAGESGVITLVEIALIAGWLIYRLQRQPSSELAALSTAETQA